jgi:outer membrane protein assembly factor BamB
MIKQLQYLLIGFLTLVMLFSYSCNSQPDNHDQVVTSQSDFQKQADEQQKEMEEQKKAEQEWMLGKSLIGAPYPNAVILENSAGDMILEAGELIYINRMYVIGYQDDVEYRWASDDPGIVMALKADQIQAVAAGTTHLRCTTRAGEQIADLAVTVMESQISRIVKNPRLDGGAYWAVLTIKDGFIYVGTCDGIQKEQSGQYYFYKMDLDLNIIWRYDLGKLGVRGSAVLDSKGNIYFTVQDFDSPGELNTRITNRDIHLGIYLYSLTGDGRFRFSKEITGQGDMMYQVGMLNIAIDKNDSLYIADGVLNAFDTDGNIQWTFDPPGDRVRSRSSPVFDSAGNMYAIMGGVAYRFNPDSNGVPAWQTTLADPYVDISPPSFNADYSRLIVPLNKTVYCLDPATGEKLWEITVPVTHGEFRANAAVDASGNIYIGTKGDNYSTFYAIKPDGSGFLWQKLIGGDLYCSPVLGDDGKMYLASEASRYGCFYCINPATGEIEWMFAESIYTNNSGMEGVGFGSIRLLDGYIYCYSDALCKIKVEADNYMPGIGWPCFRGSNDSSGYRVN